VSPCCREKDRPWAETLPEKFNPLAPSCDEEGEEAHVDGGYDMGDYFWLMGGIDVRWRPELHRKLRAAGLTKTAVVGRGLTLVYFFA
jgi:hypothetical protein